MSEVSVQRQAASERMGTLNKALLGEDDMGVVIRAHIHIEYELTEFIRARLSSPNILNQLKPTYEDKVLLAVGLGLRPDLQSALSNIGSLRNDFAHNPRGALGKQEVNNLHKAMSEEALAVARRSYAAARAKLGMSERPEKMEQQDPKDRIVLYFVTIWGVLAATVIQEKSDE